MVWSIVERQGSLAQPYPPPAKILKLRKSVFKKGIAQKWTVVAPPVCPNVPRGHTRPVNGPECGDLGREKGEISFFDRKTAGTLYKKIGYAINSSHTGRGAHLD